MTLKKIYSIALLVLLMNCTPSRAADPYILVLGIGQDGGSPQAGSKEGPAWDDPSLARRATALALVDPDSGERWLFEATPDFRSQLRQLDLVAPHPDKPGLAGILLTHAHVGHYLGLAQLGHEVIGAQGTPVYATPRMREYLSPNGPWDQLVRYRNIELRPIEEGQSQSLNSRLKVTPLRVPHREEYSEVVGYRIEGPNRSALFIPDIDSWEEWGQMGTRIEDAIATVDVAYLDGTFFANGEIPGRDMSGFPHPFISHSMQRFRELPASEKKKVRFIHLNHSNKALLPNSVERRQVLDGGFGLADEGERFPL